MEATTNIMEISFVTIKNDKPYWFDPKRKALVKLTLIRANYNLRDRSATFYWADCGSNEAVLTTEYDPNEPGKMPEFYKDPADFEKGKCLVAEELYYTGRTEKDICERLLRTQKVYRTYLDAHGAYIWTFMDGKAVKWYFREHIVVVSWEWKDDGYWTRAVADAVVPASYYDAEDVYKYNDWLELTPDGKNIWHEAVMKRFDFSKKQEGLLSKLQAVLDECKEEGIRVYYSLSCYHLQAINVKNVKRLGYDDGYDEDTELSYPLDDSRIAHTFDGVCDMNTDGDDFTFVIDK